MQWDLPGAVAFSVADDQHAGVPVEIGGVEVKRFPDADAARCQ